MEKSTVISERGYFINNRITVFFIKNVLKCKGNTMKMWGLPLCFIT